MNNLILGLISPALGILLSPLAVMALIAELLSRRFRANGVAFLIGWTVAVSVMTSGSAVVLALVSFTAPSDRPEWLSVIRLLLAIFLLMAAVWVYRKGPPRMERMQSASSPKEVAAVVPEMPSWLRRVEHFTPARSLALGFGIFVLNPVNASCAIIAGLDFATAEVPPTSAVAVGVIFVLIVILPIALPVAYVAVRGEATAPLLDRARAWIATHTNVMNAALILVIGAMQLQKAISGLLG